MQTKMTIFILLGLFSTAIGQAAVGQTCALPTDCNSNNCSVGGLCAANGLSGVCVANSDCISNNCISGSCAAAPTVTQAPTLPPTTKPLSCVLGSTYLSGSTCAPCTNPSANSYALSPCTAVSDTIIQSCPAPTAGFYTSSVCQTGSSSSRGKATVISPCTLPSQTQYTSALCSAGSSTTLGTDTVFVNCVAQTVGYVFTTACYPGSYNTLGSQAGGLLCAVGYTGSPVLNGLALSGCSLVAPASSCTSGSTFLYNGACIACTPPPAGYYTTSPCTIYANTIVSECIYITMPGYSMNVTCMSGNTTSIGSQSTINCDTGNGYIGNVTISSVLNNVTLASSLVMSGCNLPTTTTIAPTNATSSPTLATVLNTSSPIDSGIFYQPLQTQTTDSTKNSIIIVCAFFVTLIIMVLCGCKCFYMFRNRKSKPAKKREFLGKKESTLDSMVGWVADKMKRSTEKKVVTPEPNVLKNYYETNLSVVV